MLTACDRSEPPVGAAPQGLETGPAGLPAPRLLAMTMPNYVAKAQHPDHRKSWMSPEAKTSKQLLYVSDSSSNDVYVFTYPLGGAVGRLKGFKEPYGQCVDSKGDVYIANFGSGSVVEYAHGGKQAIKTLSTGGNPIGCSIDKTGDIAVTNFATPSGPGNVEIFKGGSGTPQSYGNNACYYMWPAGYDGSGNLYVEGQNGAVSVCELPAGGSSMNTVSFNKTIYFPGSVMWDGEYITLTDQEYGGQYETAIYQATAGSGTLTAVGATQLSGYCSLHYVDIVQPFIVGKANTPVNRRQGHVVEGGNLRCSGSGYGSMDAWDYPAGGAPISQIGADDPYGESVSIAGSHDLPARQRRAGQQTYTVLYNFGRSGDGFYPFAGLVAMNGALYGTTYNGGSGSGCASSGCGTLFSISASGTESVLHNFSNDGADGANPAANLIAVNGTLYGTTQNGGRYNGGTVFSITGSGTESVLHSFGGTAGISDGKTPLSSPLDLKGTLYGTTEFGGANYDGTVFSLTTSGTEKVLHSFSGSYRHGPDGGNPLAGLIAVNGTFYGTTSTGGGTDGAVGTAFSITTRGAETVLHDFSDSLDGAEPYAPLAALAVAGTTKLFATTIAGGAHYNYGAICVMDTSGNESVLHTFGLGSDGRYPQAGLIAVKQTLYGTTTGGGIDSHGTVFSINGTGSKELVLHSFAGGSSDGQDPVASLADLNGTLYGTTESGGTHGGGTVFSLKP
jgi:uncharacterized repeat protein (TIGR03803 family)